MVLLQHFTPGHTSSHGWVSLPFKIADIGWTGVDLFFVLSGFLITGILLRAKAQHRPLTHFVIRRLLRIVPAYYLALLIVFLVLPLAGLLPGQPVSVQVPFYAYVSNFFWADYGRWSAIGMGHFWSLSLEMQFYLLWPLLVYRLQTRTLVAVGVAAVVVSTVARGAGAALGIGPEITFGWTPFRWDGMLLGSLMAIATHIGVEYRRIRGLIRWTLCSCGAFALCALWFDLGAGMWLRDPSPASISLRACLPLAFSALYAALLLASLQSGWLATLLGARVFKPVARYSYGIYIIHFICAPWFEHLFGPLVLAQWFGGGDLPIYLYFMVASSVSFGLAALSYHGYEIRFLQLKPRFA